MVSKTNPFTEKKHEIWRKSIQDKFTLGNNSDYCLSLIQYLDKSPHKHFSNNAFETYRDFLDGLSISEIKSVIKNSAGSINLGLKILRDINELSIHETLIPTESVARLEFIDKNIHYNYLRLLESCFYPLISIPAHYSRLRKGKSVEGLSLYQCVEELGKGSFQFIKNHYNNTIRNGIAHGKIVCDNSNLKYIDKKGNTESISIYSIVTKFDGLLDCINGLSAALRIFFLSNYEYHSKNAIYMPQELLMEELYFQANGPAWEIRATFEGTNINKSKQLNLYVKNDFYDFNKVVFFSLRTAILTEKFTLQYNRIFMNLASKNGKSGGFVSFNADELRKLRLSGSTNMENYKSAFKDELVFFVPKYKLPQLVYKLGTYRMSFKALLPTLWPNLKETFYCFRDCKTHIKNRYIVAESVSVFLENQPNYDINEFIRDSAPSLLKKAKRYTKKQYDLMSIHHFLRVKYIKIFIYEKDQRIRRYRNGRFTSNFICCIHQNQTKKIKSPLGTGKVEHFKGFEIVWNNKRFDTLP